jgi:hypothetical protein
MIYFEYILSMDILTPLYDSDHDLADKKNGLMLFLKDKED